MTRTTAIFVVLLLSAIFSNGIGSAQARGDSGWTTLLTRKGRLAPARSVNVPLVVDLTIKRLEVRVEGSGERSVTLRRPSGEAVNAKDASQDALRVEQPDAGTWELEVKGSGDYAVTARGYSSVRFDDFELVRPLGPGPDGINTWALIHGVTHQSLAGEPVAGSADVEGIAGLEGEVASAAFTLESVEGEVLAELSFKPESYRDSDEYQGAVPLPTVPFKVVASGDLAMPHAGVRYRREFGTVLQARTVGVEAAHGIPALPVAPGQTLQLKFEVRNTGAAGTFEMSATDELDFVRDVTPKTLEIASGETATVTVALQVSEDAEVEMEDVVTLVAKHGDRVETQNRGTTTLTVVPEGDEKLELGKRWLEQ